MKKPGVDIFNIGGEAVLKDRQTDKPLSIADIPR
jgi:hypothetical protein